MAYSYACKDFPGMEQCPGYFRAATQEEVWKHTALHAIEAHGEDPATWSEDIIAQVKALIKEERD